ncbi:hypothetical protein LTR10_000364 [Elasticomyces elasticus]|nr:hypothetical protein LTR10_000364 [Elasticomyces elasticus]KAK4980384.1 hypothetical protein LTR42_000691 [Elasticomyces elasticus]KAK5730597.1 hypothetical protein LTR15_000534 [Elasticomyces elasticus]
MGKCVDTCVDFANGLQLPYDASAPGNYTLPDGTELDFGVTPVYLNQSRDGSSKVALIVIFVIAMIVSCARIFVRATTKAPGFGWDDGILILTMALYITFVGLAIATLDLGEGRHIYWIILQGMIDQNVVSKQEIMDFALHLVYNTALYCCRLSALAFFQRLSGSQKSVRLMVYIGYGVITAMYLPQMFTLIFHCSPVTALWPYDFQVESSNYKCMSWGLVYLVNGVLSLASDLMLFAIPARLISAINTDKATKAKLALILYPGVLVVAVSAGRLGILGRGIHYGDQSWFYGPMLGLEGGEIGGTMMCISVPALKVFSDRMMSSRKDNSGTSPLQGNKESGMTFTETEHTKLDTKHSMTDEKQHSEAASTA